MRAIAISVISVCFLVGAGCEDHAGHDHDGHDHAAPATQPAARGDARTTPERAGDAVERGAEATGEVLGDATREAGGLIGRGVERVQETLPEAMDRGNRAIDAAVREARRPPPATQPVRPTP